MTDAAAVPGRLAGLLPTEAADYLEGLMEGFVAYDAGWRVTYMNAAGERILGRRREDVVGKTWHEAFPHAVGNALDHMYQRVMRSRASERMELFYPHYGRWMEVSASPVRTGGIAVYFRDTTERRRAEDALRESEARFRSIFERSALPLWEEDWSAAKQALDALRAAGVGDIRAHLRASADAVGRCLAGVKLLETNRASLELFRAPDKETILQHLDRLIAAESWPVIADLLAAIAEGRNYFRGEELLNTFDGGQRRVIFDFVALPGSEESFERVLVSLVDITDLKRAEQALVEADRRKDEFLATLAHELRNPLAPIRNAALLLGHPDAPAAAQQAAREMVERQVQHMVRLIDDLLDVSRITTGKLALRQRRVTLGEIVQQALDASQAEAGHDVSVLLPPEPVVLHADPVRLAQVFANLFDNAAKYTAPGGRIELSATLAQGAVRVEVRDEGIGIAAEHLGRIFDMFTQMAPALDRAAGGLGIGLALARQLVEMHGGSIEAHSAGPGRGSAFVVRLPVAQDDAGGAPRDPEEAKAEVPVSGRRILVVDDLRDSAHSLALLLRAAGNEVQTAYDGEQALEMAEAWRPEVILLDIGLPRLNGYDACRAIRARPWSRNVVLIALTGWGQEEDRQRSKEAGFDAHMVKPVRHAELTRLLHPGGS